MTKMVARIKEGHHYKCCKEINPSSRYNNHKYKVYMHPAWEDLNMLSKY